MAVKSGWQAKYFFDIQKVQFDDIKDSFITAISKHPKLAKYYVCCPIDKADPRIPNRNFLQDRWNEFVSKCKELAHEKGINIEIEYWGAFELNNMLQKPVSAGITQFWFGGDDFSDSWFENQVTISLKNLGARHSQKLNVEIHEIAKKFDAIQRNANAKNRVFEQFSEFHKLLDNLNAFSQEHNFNLESEIEELSLKVGKCWEKITINESIISFTEIQQLSLKLIKRFNARKPNFEKREQEILFNQNLYAIEETIDSLNKSIFQLFNSPYLVVHGDAGIGKSHLLGDFVYNLNSQKRKSVFILGQSLTSSANPWTQILSDELRLNCNEDVFLGVLNTIGQAQEERVPFVIDALNEGNGRQFWKNNLAGFIEKFKNYPWVALVLSVRSEYKDDFLTNLNSDIDLGVISTVEHYGFQANIFEAIQSFFNHYELALPNEPLMLSEFTNPLFLKIYCEYRKQSNTQDFDAMLPEIFDNYFSLKNEKLSEKLEYRQALNYVQITINQLARTIFFENGHSVTYEIAMQVVSDNTRLTNPDIFLQELISENLLIAYYDKRTKTDILHFSFERFQDYLTAHFICDENNSQSDLQHSLSCDAFSYVEYKEKCISKGVLSILSVLIPAKFKKELYEIFDKEYIHENQSISNAFIESLYWRDETNFNLEKSKEFINKIISDSYYFSQFIEVLYQVAGKEKHPLNAESLHDWLKKGNLADRDSFWTTHISTGLYEGSAISVLIDWAKKKGFSESLSNESRYLIALSISWIFTSTNIKLRDKATIGLTRLLQNNLHVSIKLIDSFKGVDDPYVHERIMASIYGAVLSSSNHDGLTQICNYLINEFFAEDEVYPNVLVRDFSRNIIEFAHFSKIITFNEKQLESARPPYKSTFPSAFPTIEELDKQYSHDYRDKKIPKYHFSQDTILSSMATEYGRGTCGYGDFGRYIFESHLRNWESVHIDKLSNFSIQLIFEKYGYDSEKHGNFDRNETQNISRNENKVERIGKKYQWLAMYEVVARLSDNYKMTDPTTRWEHDKKQIWYNGSIEPSFRNIDPTFIAPTSTDNRILEKPKYDAWDDKFEKWVVSKDNLIDSKELIINQFNDGEWLSLERHIEFKPEKKLGEDNIFGRSQSLWYGINAYLVKNKDFDLILSNIESKNLMGPLMPQPKEYYNDFFNLEFHWSPLLKVHEHQYYGGSGWQDIKEDRFDTLSLSSLGKAYCCSESHRSEGIRNSDLGYNITAPAKLISESLNLKNDKFSGSWIDDSGKLVAFDASLYGDKDNNNLIIKKEHAERLQEVTDSRLIWTVLSEKIAMYENHNSTEKRLEISGVYYLEDGNLSGKDCYFVK